MKCFETVIIHILSFLITITFENVNISSKSVGSERVKVNEFVKQIQTRNSVIQRTVLVDGEETALLNFIKLPGRKHQSSSIWTTSSQKVNQMRHVLNISVACEYSEFAYFLVKLIQSSDSIIVPKEKHLNFIINKYVSLLFAPIQQLLASMILTLADLLKYTRNYASNEHEIMTILLSWYIYIVNFGNKDPKDDYIEIMEHNLKILKITHHQVEIFLKQFVINHCRCAESFKNFQNSINDTMIGLKTCNEIKTLFETKRDEFKPLILNKYLNKINVGKLFVLSLTKHHSDVLLNMIKRELSSEIIEINWNGVNNEDISIVYDKYIAEDASDIKSILKYERIILQKITKIIIDYVYSILQNIIEQPKGCSDIQKVCHDQLILTLEKYIEQFKTDGQPSYLINNMSIIRAYLWTECFYNKLLLKTAKHVLKFEQLNIQISNRANFTKFNKFLDSLSKTLICTELHPLVSNVFWDKLYFMSTNISEFVIDFKYLPIMLTEFPDDQEVYCQQISNISNSLTPIDNKIKSCEVEVNKNEQEVTQCTNKLNPLYNAIKIDVASIVLHVCGMYDFKWKKTLLALVYSMDNDKPSDGETKDHLQRLTRLQSLIKDIVEVETHATCPVKRSSLKKSLSSKASKLLKKQSSINILNDEQFIDIEFYKEFFGTINEFIVHILNNLDPVNSELRLYWDDVGMRLTDVHQRYEKHSIDQLKDNYDYLRFFIRWILATVYSKIMTIVDGIVNSNEYYAWPEHSSKDLELKFEAFKNLPFYIDMPVTKILDMFVYVLKSYDGQDIDDLNNYQKVLYDELDSLGITSLTLATNDGPFSDCFKVLIETVDYLTGSYEKFKVQIESDAEHIGIDRNDLIMMFDVWY